jgi:hypothetical protein
MEFLLQHPYLSVITIILTISSIKEIITLLIKNSKLNYMLKSAIKEYDSVDYSQRKYVCQLFFEVIKDM